MNIRKQFKLYPLIMALWASPVPAEPQHKTRIAVLDFELKDTTLAPAIPAEMARTASIKPLLEQELKKSGYEIVAIAPSDQQRANAGVGYLFDHSDSAARLGKKYRADYVIVGRLHKPSFLFFYLMAHLIETDKARLVGNYVAEVKGGEKQLILKGVESLSASIRQTLNRRLTGSAVNIN
jgi:hypothetical protein